MKRFILNVLISIFVLSAHAQVFPLTDFLKVYFNKAQYNVKLFQTDTLWKDKLDFLNRLRKFDSDAYGELNEMMVLNDHKFPESFLITDIDSDGINEYLINENYEGIFNLCYTFRDKKPVRFLKHCYFSDFLVESPEKVWLVEPESPIGQIRNIDFISMMSSVFVFNMRTLNNKYAFRLYQSYQVPFENSDLAYIDLVLPQTVYKPKPVVLNTASRFYSNYLMPDNYRNSGCINKGSVGWILADTLNSYFAVFDSTTSYVNDSLGEEKITPKDKGYLMCWIPKKVVDFPVNDGLQGLYCDSTTREYLRFFETGNKLYVNYFTPKTFERNLILKSCNKNERKATVRFKSTQEEYLLEFSKSFDIVTCINPNRTKQIFRKVTNQ